jgi:hypothetical protein
MEARMPPRDPGISLRRMIADLAALHADDLDAVLDELGSEERSTVVALMQEYAAQFDASPSVLEPVQILTHDISWLPPWLARRAGGDVVSDFAMTAQARHMLRECAVRLYPAGETHSVRPQTDLRGLPLSPRYGA